MSQIERFRRQARACAGLGSPLYAALLDRAADDIAADGVTAQLLRGYEDAPTGSAVALRLAGAVHRLVLERRAPALAVHYPSVGGTYLPGGPAADDDVWAAFREVLVDHYEDVRETLRRPPQTNEVGRSLPLLGAMAHVCRRSELPLRLLEIGASAGLNLRADALRRVHTAADLAALPAGPSPTIVERLGCDLDPVDPLTTEGRLLLTSYVWPDDAVRFERLRIAMAIAAQCPATVVRRGAYDFLRDVALRAGATTVLWHSVMWQYVDADERVLVLRERDRLAAAATPTQPFAHISFEPADPGSPDFVITLRWYDGDSAGDPELLGSAPPHGTPVAWSAP